MTSFMARSAPLSHLRRPLAPTEPERCVRATATTFATPCAPRRAGAALRAAFGRRLGLAWTPPTRAGGTTDDLAARVRTAATASRGVGAPLGMVTAPALRSPPLRARSQPLRAALCSRVCRGSLRPLRAGDPDARSQSSLGRRRSAPRRRAEYFAFHAAATPGACFVATSIAEPAPRAIAADLAPRQRPRRRFAGVLVFSVYPAILLDLLDRLKVGVQGRVLCSPRAASRRRVAGSAARPISPRPARYP